MIVEQIFGKAKYTDSERQVIDFIERNAKMVMNMSLGELSECCYVSQASIIRLCKKWGMKGFSDFKIKFASEINNLLNNNSDISVDLPITEDLTIQQIVRSFYDLSYSALRVNYNKFDYNALRRAALLISKSDIIHIYGRGESLIIAEDFHYKLMHIGKQSILDSSEGFQAAKCINSNTRTTKCALVISQYCTSLSVKFVIDELIQSKTRFILVTAEEKAIPYENFAAATLHVVSAESRYKMGAFSSRTAFLFVLDCLFGEIFSLNYEENKKNLMKYHQRKLERNYFYTSNTPL